MTDPCKKSTSVKVLRNVVKIRTGKTTKLTKKKICEAYTNIQEGKLLLPPLILTPDRTYLLDKKSPFDSNDYEKLFDTSSSRIVLKNLAEKINIKKVEALTKKQLTDTILKRLQFLNISEPIKLGRKQTSRSSPVTAVKRITQQRPAAVQSTAAKVVLMRSFFKEPTAVKKTPTAVQSTAVQSTAVKVAPEQVKVILGNRNYDLLFDPKTKREELLRIANKVGVENADNMTKKELIEATTKRVRFMSNRGLTSKNIKSDAKVPFFPKPPNRPPPITTPAFLQQKSGSAGGPPVGGPPSGTPNFLKGRTVVPIPPLPPTPGPPRPPNVKPNNVKPNNVKPDNVKPNNVKPNNVKPNNVKPNNVKPNTTNSGTGNNNVKPNNVKPNNVKPNTTNSGTGNNNVKPNNVKPNTTNSGTGNNNVRPNNNVKPNTTNSGTGNNNVRPNNNVKPNTTNSGTGNNNVRPNNGIGKNTLPPNRNNKPTTNVPPKKGKSFFNYFKSGKKKNVVPTLERQNAMKKKGKSFLNYFKSGKKKNVALPPNTANKNNSIKINNMTENLVNETVINELNQLVPVSTKNTIMNSTRNNGPNKQNSAQINNMMEELINNAVNDELNIQAIKSTKLNNNTKVKSNVTNNILNTTRNNIGNNINRVNDAKLNTTRRNEAKVNNMMEELINNTVNEELNTNVTNHIMNSMRKNVGNNINKKTQSNKKKVNNNTLSSEPIKMKPKLRLGGRAAEPNQLINEIMNKLKNDISSEIINAKLANNNKPIYNNNSNSNNNNNNNKTTKINNPTFEPTMTNNPIFNNKNSESNELSKHINNLGLPNENKKKLMNLFNNTNQTLGNAKRNANTLSNTRKLQNSLNNNGEISATSLTEEVNFNSERERLKNKITKELNLRPNNDGVFLERKGPLKGKIGVWARELRAAKNVENLKTIENKLNEKTGLRKDIENKYTKMGLTKVEKMNHRRKVVKFANNVDERRKLVEIQVKNRVNNNNNNNTNSVVSNYNSNANSNEPKKKMKYGSRENFINAKKDELLELAKNTSTNFGRNIDRLASRTNVTKLRGRIEGAVRRNEAKTRPREERRVNNRAELKNLKKKVKKNNPGFTPKKINAEARRLRALSRL
jgi:hypothetical protein